MCPTMARTGRPTKLDQPITVTDDGNVITTADVVIERVRLGLSFATAATSAGISRATLHNWRLEGARHRADQTQGRLPKPTKRQAQLIDFLDRLEKAEGEAEITRLSVIRSVGIGGQTRTKTTVRKDHAGAVIETIEVTEQAIPQWTASAWWLERRMPEKYAKRVEVTGQGGAPLIPEEERARQVADELRDFLAGAAAAAEVEAKKGKG